jgi:DNA-directed RNA polymerase specialized sigma24 family protein
MNHGNDYGDLLPQWKLTLINQRALARGVRPEDLAEIQQELILAVLGYQHDPGLGATEHTALNVVIDRQITCLQRSYARRLRRHERFCAQNDITTEEPMVSSTVPDQDLRMDVQACLQRLPETERQICAGLAADEPRVAIAKRLGLSRYETNRLIDRIAEHFRAGGIVPPGMWMGAS